MHRGTEAHAAFVLLVPREGFVGPTGFLLCAGERSRMVSVVLGRLRVTTAQDSNAATENILFFGRSNRCPLQTHLLV